MLSATNVHVTSMLLANHPRSRTEGPDESRPVYDPENPDMQRSVEKTPNVSLESISQANRTRGSINMRFSSLYLQNAKNLPLKYFMI